MAVLERTLTTEGGEETICQAGRPPLPWLVNVCCFLEFMSSCFLLIQGSPEGGGGGGGQRRNNQKAPDEQIRQWFLYKDTDQAHTTAVCDPFGWWELDEASPFSLSLVWALRLDQAAVCLEALCLSGLLQAAVMNRY